MAPTSSSQTSSPALPANATVAGSIAAWAATFERAGLSFGHGTTTARDEAAALVFHVLDLDHSDWERAYRLPVPPKAEAAIAALAERRIRERRPLPYLLGEAWFGGLPFHVNESVLIPRSPFAELISARFAPWLPPGPVGRILDLCTGSGCMAVACALAFPESEVVASDISPAALEVARENSRRHRVEDRIRLVQADLLTGLAGTFDLIVANPPYVPEAELADLPPEYHWEPRLALASGTDGMALPARIIRQASAFLTPTAWLAIEVGEGAALLEALFPRVPFVWPELASGGDGIALVSQRDLVRGLAQE